MGTQILTVIPILTLTLILTVILILTLTQILTLTLILTLTSQPRWARMKKEESALRESVRNDSKTKRVREKGSKGLSGGYLEGGGDSDEGNDAAFSIAAIKVGRSWNWHSLLYLSLPKFILHRIFRRLQVIILPTPKMSNATPPACKDLFSTVPCNSN